MNTQEQLNADLKTAMKAKDKVSLTVIRALKSQLTNQKVELGRDLTEEEMGAVVLKELKQQKESLEEFENANRDELAEEQRAQIEVTERYAPKQLSEEEISAIVKETITQVNATSMGDFGKVMGAIMPKVKGKADGNLVNKVVKRELQ